MKKLSLAPMDLGISGVNLKASAGTQYTSDLIDIGDAKDIYIIVTAVMTGATTAGDCKLTALLHDADGTTVAKTTDIGTAIATNAAGTTTAQFLIHKGTTTVNGMTVGTLPSFFSLGRLVKLRLEVTTASNAATSALGSVRLFAA